MEIETFDIFVNTLTLQNILNLHKNLISFVFLTLEESETCFFFKGNILQYYCYFRDDWTFLMFQKFFRVLPRAKIRFLNKLVYSFTVSNNLTNELCHENCF